MAFINWESDRYSVSVDSLDRQHQQLFEMINELHAAILSGEGKNVAPHIMQRLGDYTWQHFMTEEAMMQESGYPDFARHKAEHDKLVNEVLHLGDYFETKTVMSLTLLTFLKEWLENHIASSDRKYRESMQAAGIK